MNITITMPAALDDPTVAALTALVSRCDQAEGLKLPISPEVGPTTGMLLACVDGELAGAAQLQFGTESEISLCVDPAWRRRGIGRALAQAARAQVAARGPGAAIFVADTAAESGQAFAVALNARLEFSEHSLDLDLAAVPPAPPALPGLTIRPARPADAPAIVEVLMAAFGDPREMVERFVSERIGSRAHRFLVGEHAGRAAGVLRLVGEHEWVYVTTFGVLPELQGRGIGRRLLLHAVELLRGEGHAAIRIEVVTTNASALGLYEACGFRRKRTFAYLVLPEPATI